VGCGILAPLNYNDTYIADHPSGKKEENGTLEKLTILNISQGSSRYASLFLVHSLSQLTPKGPRTHSFKMINSIDHIVKNTIQIGPKFISPELVKIIAYVGLEKNNIGQEKVQIGSTQNC
jgi:hypothetical protein